MERNSESLCGEARGTGLAKSVPEEGELKNTNTSIRPVCQCCPCDGFTRRFSLQGRTAYSRPLCYTYAFLNTI